MEKRRKESIFLIVLLSLIKEKKRKDSIFDIYFYTLFIYKDIVET